MLSFHKLTLHDIRRYNNIIANTSHILQHDLTYLYIFQDYYTPEICFYNNKYIFIRITSTDLGVVYFPPIILDGTISYATSLIKEDCHELNIPFIVGPVDKTTQAYYTDVLHLTFKSVDFLSTYIYSVDSLYSLKEKKYKGIKKELDFMSKYNRDFYHRAIVKEDFKDILEFVSIWYQSHKELKYKDEYFITINSLKRIFEILYELNLIAFMLYTDNEIVGVVFAGITNNICHTYLKLSYDNRGVDEALVNLYSKILLSRSKYFSLRNDFNSSLNKENNLKYIPIEKLDFIIGGSYEGQKK